MVGGTGTVGFDLDWTGNMGMLTTSPLALAGTGAKEVRTSYSPESLIGL